MLTNKKKGKITNKTKKCNFSKKTYLNWHAHLKTGDFFYTVDGEGGDCEGGGSEEGDCEGGDSEECWGG